MSRLWISIAIVGIAFANDSYGQDTTSSNEQKIRRIHELYSAAMESKDYNAIMSLFLPDERLVVFDAAIPRQYVGPSGYRKAYQDFFAFFSGPIKSEFFISHISTSGTSAYAYGVFRWAAATTKGVSLERVFRFTDVFEKIGDKWLIVHEHMSLPFDPETGKVDYLSKP
jgi:ketosteroid isomerase-like protein